MKVSELIEKLKLMPSGFDVVVKDEGYYSDDDLEDCIDPFVYVQKSDKYPYDKYPSKHTDKKVVIIGITRSRP